jgi:L-iditol 2-dehydrogenase
MRMGWSTGIYALPKGPRVSGLDAVEVAKSGWEGLKGSESVTSVLGLEDGFDAVFECTGVESCMQLAVMVSPVSPHITLTACSIL